MRSVLAYLLFGLAAVCWIQGWRHYMRLWKCIRPELMADDTYEGRRLRQLSKGSGVFDGYEMLRDIWTDEGRYHRSRLAVYLVAAALLAGLSTAHFARWW
jgi:hypothetical protein